MTTTEQSIEHTEKHTTENAPTEITDGITRLRPRRRDPLARRARAPAPVDALLQHGHLLGGRRGADHGARRGRLRLRLARQPLPRRPARGCSRASSATGARDIAEAAAQARRATLGYFPLWTYAHPTAIELAEKLASLTPGDLNRVFFTSGGSEAVESAWKLARQYHRLMGDHDRYKVISRDIAYHGTTMGALTITSVIPYRTPFEPLVPGRDQGPEHEPVPRARARRRRGGVRAVVAPTRSKTRSCARAPRRWRRSSSSRCRTPAAASRPPPGYFQRVREICDRYGVLFVSDEVICAFGRLGTWFGGQKYDYVPDMITCAKGMTSGYAPARRADRERPGRRAVLRGRPHVPARPDLRRPPGELRGRAQEHRDLRDRARSSST